MMMSDFVLWKSKFKNTYNIISEDFTNDVSLEVSGDFKDEEEYKATAELICKKLNTIQQLTDENKALREKYNELLFAVASKFPDESRHETALRYINNAENQCHGPEQAAKQGDK